MNALRTLLFLLFVLPCLAVGPSGGGFTGKKVTSAGAAPTVFLFTENFETPTTGYENTPAGTGGTQAPATSTTGLSLEASQCLSLANGTVTWNLTSTTSGHWNFMFRLPAVHVDFTRRIFDLDVTNDRLNIQVQDTTGKLELHSGGNTTALTTTGLSVNTTYKIWIDWNGDGTASVCYAASPFTKPTFTLGVVTADSTSLASGASILAATDFRVEGLGVTTYYDHILYAATPIGNNP